MQEGETCKQRKWYYVNDHAACKTWDRVLTPEKTWLTSSNALGPIKFSAYLESYLGYKHFTVVVSYRKLLVVRLFIYFAIVEVYKLVFL